MYAFFKANVWMRVEKKIPKRGGVGMGWGCLLIAMSTDPCWVGHLRGELGILCWSRCFCVEPCILRSNQAFCVERVLKYRLRYASIAKCNVHIWMSIFIRIHYCSLHSIFAGAHLYHCINVSPVHQYSFWTNVTHDPNIFSCKAIICNPLSFQILQLFP